MRDITLMGFDRVVQFAQEAIEREVPGWAPSIFVAADQIKAAQERYSRWGKKREYSIYACVFFRDGHYRGGPEEWEAAVGNSGKQQRAASTQEGR